MSVRVNANRRILHNITNMEDRHVSTKAEEASNDLNELSDEPLKVEPTLDTATVTATLPVEEKRRLKADNEESRVRAYPRSNGGKFESGSGSGEQDGMQVDDGMDTATKKRKTRRGKPRHRKLKPYSQQPQSNVKSSRCRPRSRLTKPTRQPPAPYNTNQFLIEDHNDLPDLEQKLSVVAAPEIPTAFPNRTANLRTRDSSFSVDSDEDYFYSSPEDEEEFLTKEFSSAYEDVHAERLGNLTKSELIEEYIQLEAKVDLLTKRLKSRNATHAEDNNVDSKNCVGDAETAKKLKIFQQRIDDLLQQNEQLRKENEKLKAKNREISTSSEDSLSDSDSSGNVSNRPSGLAGVWNVYTETESSNSDSRPDLSHVWNTYIDTESSSSDCCRKTKPAETTESI